MSCALQKIHRYEACPEFSLVVEGGRGYIAVQNKESRFAFAKRNNHLFLRIGWLFTEFARLIGVREDLFEVETALVSSVGRNATSLIKKDDCVMFVSNGDSYIVGSVLCKWQHFLCRDKIEIVEVEIDMIPVVNGSSGSRLSGQHKVLVIMKTSRQSNFNNVYN